MSDHITSTTVALLTAFRHHTDDPALATEGVAMLRGLSRLDLELVCCELAGMVAAADNFTAEILGVSADEYASICLELMGASAAAVSPDE
jgi:hypothetical protein